MTDPISPSDVASTTDVLDLTDADKMPENQEGVTVEHDPLKPVYDTPAAVTEPTPLEAAAKALIHELEPSPLFETSGFIRELVGRVREEVDRAQAVRLDTPKLLEVTGNVEERELAARYMEQKALAARNHARRYGANFEDAAQMFLAAAIEFRGGLHLPEVVVGDGRIIPYNETNDTGIRHESSVNLLVQDVHARNVKAGWWHDLETGEPKERNAGELIALIHSEVSEALEGVRKNQMDDHLPHRKMEEVEMADAVIRIADYCGGRGLDLGGAIDEKLAYNAKRADHKIENRLKDDGKKM